MSWLAIKELLISQLKGAAFKATLKKFLGTAAGGGLKAWVIKKILTEFSDEIGEPVVRGMLTNVGYIYDKIDGHVVIKRMRKAEQENNSGGYDSAVDDIYS